MNNKLPGRDLFVAACTLALCWCARPGAAQVSSGGNYSMNSSVTLPGSRNLTGGNFSVDTVMGQYNLPTTIPSDELYGANYLLRMGFLNPPHFGMQSCYGLDLWDPSHTLHVVLAPYSVPVPSFNVLFNNDPASNPSSKVDPAIIAEANRKMLLDRGPFAQAVGSNIWEIDVQNVGSYYSGPISPNGAISMSFQYATSNSGVFEAGTNPPVKASTLQLWRLDEQNAIWMRVADSEQDLSSHRITAPLRHLSVYALIGGADTAVNDVFVYPVPFRPNGPNAGIGAGRTGAEWTPLAGGITFGNLPSEGSIEIYTLSGQLVRTLAIPPSTSTNLRWDVKNSAGQSVASGVYIWRVVSGNNSKTGRLMVIR